MKKIDNLTGRVFMCVGIDKDDVYECSESFTTGRFYLEVQRDNDGINLCDGNDLLLNGDNNVILYVSGNDFAEVLDLSSFIKNELNHVNK